MDLSEADKSFSFTNFLELSREISDLSIDIARAEDFFKSQLSSLKEQLNEKDQLKEKTIEVQQALEQFKQQVTEKNSALEKVTNEKADGLERVKGLEQQQASVQGERDTQP